MISSDRLNDRDSVLFLFAHNDDEFFVLPQLEREVAAGHRVVCVYTTDGAAYGESPKRRLDESLSVLCPRGVAVQDIIPLGDQIGVRDGVSHRSIERLWERLLETVGEQRFSRIYVPAWEGGHADHDAAHLLAVALSRIQGAEVVEFSLYHSYRATKPLIRCVSLIPFPGRITHTKVSLRGALSWILEARRYPSQRRAFVGLLPFCLPQILIRRSLPLRVVESRSYRHRPHEGRLFYEIRFKVPYEEFYSATVGFIDRAVDPPDSCDARAS
jgi:LmbE family N-acetylglucosaminyl deacetylase